MNDNPQDLINPQSHRAFAVNCNDRVWALLEKHDRNSEENDELLYAAFASCYHWTQIGHAVHRQRGEYLISKVYVDLRMPAQALHHAQKCLTLTELYPEQMADFDVAFAYECMARAYALIGDTANGTSFYRAAKNAGAVIQDVQDQEIFENDLAGGDWFGMVFTGLI